MTDYKESAQITINAPASAVFAILRDPAQHVRIDGSGTVVAQVQEGTQLELGSKFGMKMRNGVPYTMTNRVVEFEQDQLIAWRHMGAHRWRYELEPTDTGTIVTETWDLSRHNPVAKRALYLAFGRRTRKAIEATLVKLKAAAEADAAS